MAGKLVRPSSLAVVIVALCTWCALPPSSAAAQAQSPSPAMPSTAGVSGDSSGPTTTLPAAAAALPPSTPAASVSASSAAATASKKFPLPTPGGEPYFPAAEVASALPVPTPDELPSAASIGFGNNGGLGFGGPGDECCGGGGYGWFGGPGGFGPGTYGYNGPLYFGSAPAGGLRNVAAANVLVPLVVACAFAAMLA